MARKTEPVTWETVRQIALALPGAEEGTSYGTPAIKVRGTLFARLRECGDLVVVKIDKDERTMRLRTDPEAYCVTDHYLPHPLMLVRLSRVDRADLAELLVESWRRSAPKRLIAAYDGGA